MPVYVPTDVISGTVGQTGSAPISRATCYSHALRSPPRRTLLRHAACRSRDEFRYLLDTLDTSRNDKTLPGSTGFLRAREVRRGSFRPKDGCAQNLK